MVASESQATVASLVRRHPTWIDAMERIGIDYCCHGRETLAAACKQRDLDVASVLEQLHGCEETASTPHMDVQVLSFPALIDHIVGTHHGFLRQQLPLLDQRLGQVLVSHGEKHLELREVKSVFHEFRGELESHMLKEELILFPWALRLASNDFHSSGDIAQPIAMMEKEHLEANDSFIKLRLLTDDFRVPADACPAYRSVMVGLGEIERDLHLHVHEENNVLFPQLAELAVRQKR